jgi:hypothetical protein
MFGSIKNIIILAVVIIILALVPHFTSSYVTYVVVLAMLFSMLTGSFDLFVGYTGPLSFCHGAFYGLGAYTSAILVMRLGLSFWLAMPITAVIVMLFAVIVGAPALKVRGALFCGDHVLFRVLHVPGVPQHPQPHRRPHGDHQHSAAQQRIRDRIYQHDRQLLFDHVYRAGGDRLFAFAGQIGRGPDSDIHPGRTRTCPRPLASIRRFTRCWPSASARASPA